MRRNIPVVTLTLAAALIAFGVRMGALGRDDRPQPATVPAHEEVLPALLIEIRGLRAAMEQAASAGPRVQLALGRVQLQEQRITGLIRRLDEVRASANGARHQVDELQRQRQGIEDAVRDQGPNAPPASDWKAVQLDLQRQVAAARTDLERASADEAAVKSQLALEQARWTDLNQRMEALEATLGPR